MPATTLAEQTNRTPRRQSDDSALLSETHTRTIRFHLLKFVAQFVISVLVVALPIGLSTERRLVILTAMIACICLGVVMARSSRFRDPITSQNLLAAAQTLVAVALVPELWAGLLVAFCMMVIAAGAVWVRAVTVLALVIGATLFAFVGAQSDLQSWPANLAIAVTTTVGAIIYYQAWSVERTETDRRYERLADQARVFFWEVDLASMEIRDVNGGTEGALGWSRDEVIGKQTELFLVSNDAIHACSELELDTDHEAILSMLHRDGRSVQVHSNFVVNKDGTIRGTGMDVTEIRLAAKTIRWQSQHDVLTGLPNRDSLHKWLYKLASDNPGADPGLALLLLDIDRFKEVNDTLGHGVGDTLLRSLAERFTAAIGDRAQIARVGGDEFGFVISRTDLNLAEVRLIAEEIADAARAAVSIDGLSLTVGASIGIAIGEAGCTATELMRRADIAMYESKRTSTRFSFFANTQQQFSVERLKLAAEVAGAIEHKDIQLWLQKKVDSRSGRITGAEGLARWVHPVHGVLSPARFLDLVEVSDAHEAFANHILCEGVRLAAECRRIDPAFVTSINMTPRSLANPSFPRRLATLLVHESVPPEAITLELTERDIMQDLDGVVNSCRTLAGMGINISIDDFGTGWSSLERLRQLPVSEVKIDRSFVQGIATNDQDRRIARSIIDLASSLEMSCVAEGVERAEHASTLVELGCHTLQGYYFGGAVPEEEFLIELAADGG